ncbi:MAG: respiratory nitrate reductase subunit gamma [Melioribacteraceae bacterium]|nr:respiratory nitrate reductase subunit gamma [Melioribacteraceae bacterium]
MALSNNFFFIGLPYMALIVFLIGSIYRYRSSKFTYSSLSSQFLETRKLYWGSLPFHWGIVFLFFGHLTAFLFPRSVLLWNEVPIRLVILEITAFVFGIMTLVGLANLFYRRLSNPRVRKVSNYMDIILEILLLTQVFLGLWVAYGYRWGSSWFSIVLTPYLNSIFLLNPQADAIFVLPLVIQLHIIFAFLIIMIIPFTRLVHFLVFPLSYLWRPYQKVIWNWDRKKIRDPKTKWTIHKPTNN